MGTEVGAKSRAIFVLLCVVIKGRALEPRGIPVGAKSRAPFFVPFSHSTSSTGLEWAFLLNIKNYQTFSCLNCYLRRPVGNTTEANNGISNLGKGTVCSFFRDFRWSTALMESPKFFNSTLPLFERVKRALCTLHTAQICATMPRSNFFCFFFLAVPV